MDQQKNYRIYWRTGTDPCRFHLQQSACWQFPSRHSRWCANGKWLIYIMYYPTCIRRLITVSNIFSVLGSRWRSWSFCGENVEVTNIWNRSQKIWASKIINCVHIHLLFSLGFLNFFLNNQSIKQLTNLW